MNLVNRVWPDEDLELETSRYILDLVERCSPRSLGVIKRQVWEASMQTLSESVRIADSEMHASFCSEDFREGVESMQGSRPPKFSGN